MAPRKDCWAEWVARMRPSSSDESHPHRRWRDRVLDNGEPIAGRTVLDVGCGEGLIAFGALERNAREAIFSDVSQDLLDACREAASHRGVLDRSRFVRAPADDLAPVADAAVDVVTTRSVLIYVTDKRAAFREFARVLRPGGRVSIFEPINRFARDQAPTWMGYDLGAVAEIGEKLRAVYESIQPPDSDPMLDFDERDLVAYAEAAGFRPLRLELEAEIAPHEPLAWDKFVSRAGNPRIPTLEEAMSEALTASERGRLTAHLRPLVEAGQGTNRMALAFLRAVKPLEESADTLSPPRRGSSVGRAHG